MVNSDVGGVSNWPNKTIWDYIIIWSKWKISTSGVSEKQILGYWSKCYMHVSEKQT